MNMGGGRGMPPSSARGGMAGGADDSHGDAMHTAETNADNNNITNIDDNDNHG
jgi:hypothetical protein